MANISKIRANEFLVRANRLVHGEFRSDDLWRLLSHLRQSQAQFGCVRDVGDFIAHAAERDRKGAALEAAQDHYASFQLHFHIDKHKQIDLQRLPPFALRALSGRLARTSKLDLRKLLATSKTEASKQFERVRLKFRPSQNGDFALVAPLTPDELRLVEVLATRLIVETAYDQTRLFDELWQAILREKLLQTEDEQAFNARVDRMSVEIVAILHGATIKLNATDSCLLTANAGGNWQDGLLAINFQFPNLIDGRSNISISTAMYATKLKAGEWCSSSLSLDPQARWDFPLDVNSDGRLASLT